MTSALPSLTTDRYRMDVRARHARGRIMRGVFLASTVVALVALMALGYNIVKEAFGLVAIQDTIAPSQLSDRPLEELSKDELVAILQEHVSAPVFQRMETEQPFAERSQENVLALVIDRVVEPEVVQSWPLNESLFQRAEIEAAVAAETPEARLEWKSWLSPGFLSRTMSSDPARAGVRTALLGSLWMMAITLAVAFPVGVASAVYLEEYAGRGRINRIIQTNIDNLAGVPSIIYGMLGLAIFVRALGPLTSGEVFGVTDTNGRTILSAGLTMALLILPVIIINAQEAIRAVPGSLREAAFGLGATKWQTVWGHVLPYALPGILTGTILALSRAIGETAPLIVVGASTFIVADPTGPFSKFTALPIQIYNWTSRPQDQFRDIAAAAILVLLATLLSINAAAILLRNRFSRRM
jgi:phosphate transport system permease protein